MGLPNCRLDTVSDWTEQQFRKTSLRSLPESILILKKTSKHNLVTCCPGHVCVVYSVLLGVLATPVPSIRAANGSSVDLACTFTISGQLSPIVEKNMTALIDNFGPRWFYGLSALQRRQSGCPTLDGLTQLSPPATLRTTSNGTRILTSVLSLPSVDSCTATEFLCVSVFSSSTINLDFPFAIVEGVYEQRVPVVFLQGK